EIEPLLIMRPPRGFWLFMILIASCVHRNMPVKLVATTFCQVSNGRSSSGTAGAPIPALLNKTSSRPKVDFIVANRLTIDSRFETSVGTARACAPVALISAATLSSISLRRPASTRLYPALASAMATARPTPVPAPVTSAIFAVVAISFPFPAGLETPAYYENARTLPLAVQHVSYGEWGMTSAGQRLWHFNGLERARRSQPSADLGDGDRPA